MSKLPLMAAAALSAVLLIGSSAMAQVANPDPSAVKAGTYALEPTHTRVVFAVSHMGFSTWYGDFTGAAGSLTVNPGAPALDALEVTIPVAGVATTNATLDKELKSPAWFDATGFPTITFKSTKVTPTGPGSADVTGDLTFHGVTKPITLAVVFKAAGVNPLTKAYTAGFEAKGRLKRSDFGVKTYVPLIGDDVDLTISAPFEKK